MSRLGRWRFFGVTFTPEQASAGNLTPDFFWFFLAPFNLEDLTHLCGGGGDGEEEEEEKREMLINVC